MRSVFLRRPPAEELSLRHGPKRYFFIWAPAALGVCVIGAESTPFFSAANTGHWLRPVAERLFGPISTPVWEHAHHLLRKSGHFLGYGTLCILFLRGWLLTFANNETLNIRDWRMRSWMFALLSTFVVASCDELHQSFLPTRTGRFSDVVLDTCGGLVLTGLVLGWNWRSAGP